MTPEAILDRVAQACNVPVASLTRKGRSPYLSRAKLVATWEIRKGFPHWPLVEVSRLFGEASHCTIIHRLRKAEWLTATDPSFRALVAKVWEKQAA